MTKMGTKEIEQAKYDAHIEELKNTKYELSALTVAQISELLQHLASIPYMDIIGMIGSEIQPQLPKEAQEALAKSAAEIEEPEVEPVVEDAIKEKE